MPIRLRRKGPVAKWALRRAIQSLVPDETAWAGRRPHLGWRFNMLGAEQLCSKYSREELIRALGRRVDKHKADLAIDSWRRAGDNARFPALHAALCTSVWLQRIVDPPRFGAASA
jgi:hypothetical protein